VVQRPWPGIVPVSTLVVVLLLGWAQWVWSQVTPSQPGRPSAVVQTSPAELEAERDCVHERLL
jgi:hypothetical protein